MRKTQMGAGPVFVLAIAITAVISPNLTDPVMLPKFLLLLLFTIPLFILTFRTIGSEQFELGLLAAWRYVSKNTQLVLASFFLFFHGVSALFSQSPTTGIFGNSGRRNGFLTYLALFLLFIIARRYANRNSLNSFLVTFSCVGGFESIYMLVQKIGMDPVPWKFVYANTMIGTLGNPDFASAIVAFSCPASVYLVYVNVKEKKKASLFLILFLAQITALLVSMVYQGPIALALAGIIVGASIVWITKPSLPYRVLVSAGVFLSALVAALGALGQGPLAFIFTKQSFQLRLHAYWETAVDVGLRHIFFGVGPDQFGDQVNRFYTIENRRMFGPVETDNAHNYFLQFFAEIGLPGALFFLLLSLVTVVKAFRDLSHASANELALKLAVIATLTVYFAQAFISVEHIAISIWFWILLGLLSGESNKVDTNREFPRNITKSQRGASRSKVTSGQISSTKKTFATATGVLLLAISSLVYNLDNQVWKVEQSLKSQQGSDLTEEDLTSLSSAVQRWPYDAQLATRASSLLLTFGQDTGLKILKRAISHSPESAPALLLLASYNEQKVNRRFGIEPREKLVILQPFTEDNYVELIRDYLFVLELDEASSLAMKLKVFAAPETMTLVNALFEEYYIAQAG